MGCTWCKMLNPCNMWRAVQDCAPHCWRRMQVFFWTRILRSTRSIYRISPTLVRLFEASAILREYSLQAENGSESSLENSTSIEQSSQINASRRSRSKAQLSREQKVMESIPSSEMSPQNEASRRPRSKPRLSRAQKELESFLGSEQGPQNDACNIETSSINSISKVPLPLEQMLTSEESDQIQEAPLFPDRDCQGSQELLEGTNQVSVPSRKGYGTF